MSLFKRAFARGINDELVRLNLVRYPTKLAADEIADAVGDQIPQEPVGEDVPAETAAEVAATLIDAANELISETGASAMPEVPAAPEEALKTSAAQDIDTRAQQQAYYVMVKAAQEKQAMGSTIEGGDKGNTLMEAAATTGEGKIEADRRPDGYANVGVMGVGETQTPIGRDASTQVGKEEPHPDQPGATDAGSNSVIEQSKTSQLRRIIQKVAMGTTIEGGDKGNTLGQAGALTGEGKLEADRRPVGYANVGVGKTNFPVGTGVVGAEQPHPDQPGAAATGSNSVTQWSESAKEGSADPFLVLFKKTAEEVSRFLPKNMSEDTKVAHVRRLMGLTDPEKTEYIALIHKEAGASDAEAFSVAEKHAGCKKSRYSGNPNKKDRTRANQKKTAEEMTSDQEEKLPEGLKEVIEEKKEEPKKEEKCSECGEASCKCNEKEGSDLLSRIRQMTQRA